MSPRPNAPNLSPSTLPNGCPNDNGEPLHREEAPIPVTYEWERAVGRPGGRHMASCSDATAGPEFCHLRGCSPRGELVGGGPKRSPLATTRRSHAHRLAFRYVSTGWLSMAGDPIAVRAAGGAPCAGCGRAWIVTIDRFITVRLVRRHRQTNPRRGWGRTPQK